MPLNIFKEIFNPILYYFGKKKAEKHFKGEPILIGGCGRSGTTLLLSIFSAHSDVYAFPKEIGAFSEWNEGEARLDRLYRYILTHKLPEQKKRMCEKTPANIRYFDKILNHFNQNVKLIHLIRDGRDVMLSKHPKDPNKYWVSPKRWVNDVRAGLEYKDHPNVLTIKYEDLILTYQKTIEEITDFCNLELSDKILNWHQHTEVRKNEAWNSKVKKIHSNSVGKYKRSDDKKRIQEIMSNSEVVKLLRELNYPLE